MTRRDALRLMAAGVAVAGAGCATKSSDPAAVSGAAPSAPSAEDAPPPVDAPDPVLGSGPLGFQWPTRDPFLFCVHHDDHYPAGTGSYGPPSEALSGRRIGMDFELRDGFRMYHGDVVPGFPRHPHRGFETVTVVRRGLLDHADSMGAAARYGGGDVQWLTAGAGIQHAEMFPLLRGDADNPLELFQIWLNLPGSHKMVQPHFSMLWSERIPAVVQHDAEGRKSEVTVIAGSFGDAAALPPPPDSWASKRMHDVGIWTLRLDPRARLTLPAAQSGSNRTLYAFLGEGFELGGGSRPSGSYYDLRPDQPVELHNGSAPSELLMLQGRPIGEPVAQHGPFVMNSPAELRRAYLDYQRTGFGGWSWGRNDPVHGPKLERFALRPDGTKETPA